MLCIECGNPIEQVADCVEQAAVRLYQAEHEGALPKFSVHTRCERGFLPTVCGAHITGENLEQIERRMK